MDPGLKPAATAAASEAYCVKVGMARELKSVSKTEGVFVLIIK
jgi:hypothetical protein